MISLKTKYIIVLIVTLTLDLSIISTAPANNDESNDSETTTLPSSETPTTNDPKSNKDDSSTTELPEFTSFKNTSTFSCQGRATGYYADVKLGCRIYHFCTQIESIDGTTYQRMSYICLEKSIFDQKDLNCVKEADLKVTCDKAEAEYELSNKQFDPKEESQPSMSDNLAANIMMNPITRFIAG